ncbi:proton-coupled amino acid transporter 3-like [Pyrus ussuriensis x Pyrus communis]|uniref:Proton-coupled amino acid transporter 3-like n=1 Tax=Pyrus ussuriensis x Pyrus communis TaxID=2448454 RepID=A0A5N5GAG0_9ROSA|nr:proton-coupled amino acid transporter 3-like [Pyrus ussuriensis x Pyrus communis]
MGLVKTVLHFDELVYFTSTSTSATHDDDGPAPLMILVETQTLNPEYGRPRTPVPTTGTKTLAGLG